MSDHASINGEALRAYRKSLRMTLEELGKSCHKSGQWVGGLEKHRNGNVATDLEAYQLAMALGIKVDDLQMDAQ